MSNLRDTGDTNRKISEAEKFLLRAGLLPKEDALIRKVDLSSTSIKQNTSSSVEDYDGTTWRSIYELYSIMGKQFRKHVRNLPKGSSVLLPGGGYAIYGLELAQMGHRVVSVNPQDFYSNSPLARMPEEREHSVFSDEKKWFYSLGKVRINVFNRLARALEIPFPQEIIVPEIRDSFLPWLEVWKLRPGVTIDSFWTSALHFHESLLKMLRGGIPLRNDGIHARYQGLAEYFLPLVVDNSTNLIVDVLDAFTYSSHKPLLLSYYYAKLSKGAKAYIYIENDDLVSLRNHSREAFKGEDTSGHVPLSIYLAKRFPEIFSLIQHEKKMPRDATGPLRGKTLQLKILEITKAEQGVENSFFKSLAPGETWVRDRGGSQVYPTVLYEEL